MGKKYSREEIEQHAKALGMSDVGDLSTLSKSEYKNFTNELNEFKAEEQHKTVAAKQKAKVFRATAEGKNYTAKAKAAKARASDADKASGDISIADLPASVTRRIDKEIPVKTTTTAAGDDAHKDLNISKARYDYRPNVVVGGTNVFHGTNIPTTGFSPEVIAQYNATLKADIDNKDWYGANDTLFSIAYAQGGGQGNPRVGALQSGMWRVTEDPKATLWAEQNLNSANDQYILRDDTGKPTGVVLGYDEDLGIIRGTPKAGQQTNWKSIGSWGGNARAGILEGRPTQFPQAGLTTTSIFNPDRPGIDQFTGRPVNRSGTPTYTGPLGAGGSGEYLSTPYTRPALQDWSALAPPEMPGLLGTAQAQQALLANNLAAYQPQAQGGVLDYAPRGGSTWAPRTYTLGGAGAGAGAGAGTGAGTGNGKTYGPGGTYDNYQDWYMAPENPAGHYWALANTARAKGEVSPWGNQMEGGIWKYTGGSSPLGSTSAIVGRDLGEDTRLLNAAQNQYLAGNQATIGGSLFDSPEERAAWLENTYREFPNWGTDVGRDVNVPYIPGTEGISPSMSLEGFSEAALGGPLSQQQMYDPQFAGSFPGMSVGLLGPR